MSDAYKKAYEREKISRQSAEILLDEKTREVQANIDMIQQQFNDLRQQKKESDYLLSVARLSQNDLGLASIIKQYLLSTIGFLEAKVGRYTYLKDNVLVIGKALGVIGDLPKFSDAFYKTLYQQENRSTLKLSDIGCEEVNLVMDPLGIDRVAFIPIKCFGKTSTVCEIFLPKNTKFNAEMLEQCLVAGYQIGGMVEKSLNSKKLEMSYQEIKASNETIKKTQNQLVQSEKMASLGQLAAGVAHEINNPIGFVMSNVGTLKEYSEVLEGYVKLANSLSESIDSEDARALKEIDDDEDVAVMVNDIKSIVSDCSDGLKRVKDIVANLKSFARSDEEKNEPFNLNECIEKTLKVVWNELKYNVTLNRHFDNKIALVKGHEGQVGQVIMNMLVNAGQAMESPGEITLSTSQKNEWVILSIRDTGKGISKEVMDKIFDPFFTTKEVNEGTGLGLSISYGIIEKHGGNIQVNSKESEGTEFIITLPQSL